MAIGQNEEAFAMFRVIEATKEAVQQFERGEINVREAIRLIVEATTFARAA